MSEKDNPCNYSTIIGRPANITGICLVSDFTKRLFMLQCKNLGGKWAK